MLSILCTKLLSFTRLYIDARSTEHKTLEKVGPLDN